MPKIHRKVKPNHVGSRRVQQGVQQGVQQSDAALATYLRIFPTQHRCRQAMRRLWPAEFTEETQGRETSWWKPTFDSSSPWPRSIRKGVCP
jgi:hypothetical protein